MRKIIKNIIIVGLIICLPACKPPTPPTSGFGDPTQPKSYQYAGNIWQSLAYQFDLPDETPTNPEVRKQINWYMSNQKYLIKIAKRAEPYIYYIYQQVRRRNLPAEFALLPIVESEYEPLAYSKAGAAGLWQIMPGTASGYGIKIDWWYDGRRDIVASTNAALDLLSYLGNFFNNNWLLAIAAYDTGDGVVDTAMRRNAKAGEPVDFWHLPLSKETKSYVPKLLALATIIKHPYDYPIALPPIKNAPYLTEVDIGAPINLSKAAKMANISLEQLIRLNPGYNRWTTDPNGRQKLLLPIEKATKFKDQLARLPKSELVNWQRYKITIGDSLLSIAYKFKTSVALLKHVNQLKTNTLNVNQTLLIPGKSNKLTQSILKAEQSYFKKNKNIPELKIIKYLIKKGDNLWDIAKHYHVKPNQILFWNGLKSHNQLKVGAKLIIWPPRQHYKTITEIVRHNVVNGDSLNKIAHQYHISITQLKKLNKLTRNVIKPGQSLIVRHRTLQYANKNVYAHNTIKVKKRKTQYHPPRRIVYHTHSGDSLSKIAHKYKISIAKLESWNKIDNLNNLQPHQELVIYR